MVCHNCNSEIEEGTKFCTQCGTSVVLESKNESKKPDSSLSQLYNSITKSKLFAGTITLLSLMIQTIILVQNSNFIEQTQFVYPIVCAVLAIILYIKIKTYKFYWVAFSSLIAFIISPIPLWILMIMCSRPDYGRLGAMLGGLFFAVQLIARNMLYFYPVILAWFIGYTIIKKLNKTNK